MRNKDAVLELILYSRSYCHLCDDLLQALQQRFGGEFAFQVRVVDIDLDGQLDAALVARFDELVPVLVGTAGGREQQLCHYFLDEAAVAAYLEQENCPKKPDFSGAAQDNSGLNMGKSGFPP